MAVNNPRELLVYRLSLMRDVQRSGVLLLRLLAGRRPQNSDLEQLLRAEELDSERQAENINSCLQALNARPIETRSATVEGMRTGYEEFLRLGPAPEMQDLFAIDTGIRYAYLAIASYRSLIDSMALMGESRCTASLLANLRQKEESAGRLERIGYEMGEGLFVAA
jgi:ferritin-like metal-binding protein YciE